MARERLKRIWTRRETSQRPSRVWDKSIKDWPVTRCVLKRRKTQTPRHRKARLTEAGEVCKREEKDQRHAEDEKATKIASREGRREDNK